MSLGINDLFEESIDKEGTPTPEQIIIELPLYKEITFNPDDSELAETVELFAGSIDLYCLGCKKESVFKRVDDDLLNLNNIKGRNSTWVKYVTKERLFIVNFECTRNIGHLAHFIFTFSYHKSKGVNPSACIKKIGQYPSIADLQLPEIKKYKKILGNYYSEFTKSIGLHAHGVGVGSFVYLRRIFENLIEEAHLYEKSIPGWDENKYNTAKVPEKIDLLKDRLPEFLVVNKKKLYGILSKGLHELSEEVCLGAFPLMKSCIELILDAKLDATTRRTKEEEAQKGLHKLKI